MVTIGTITIMTVITITSTNRTLSVRHLRFPYLPFLRERENARLLPNNGMVFARSIISSITPHRS